MKVNTKYFGTVEYTKQDIIHFSEGLYGFETQTDFLPVSFESDNDFLLLLQSITDESISFIVMNPFCLDENYHPLIPETERALLGNPKEEDVSYYVICVLKEQISESTVNLKCPIAVNTVTRNARQVILSQPNYTFKHPLSLFSKKED